ncbi:hypothetical protein [Afifella pfennigii]|uniref:hypothetical protein n=1 Tax=Afifella pfennigii TaxID=209897 RepID=UPI0012EB3757|nr:hypothetical protein [Afifella pfennigii]
MPRVLRSVAKELPDVDYSDKQNGEETAGEPSVADYVVLQDLGDRITISLVPPDDFRRRLTGRMSGARRSFRRSMRRLSGEDISAGRGLPAFQFDAIARGQVEEALHTLRRRLSAIFDAPIPAGEVSRILRITSQERRRWMKDGRLPSAPRQRSGRAEKGFNVHVFSAALVALLERSPGTIEAWREEDLKRPGRTA